MKINGWLRFLTVLVPCTVYRFYLGERSMNFLWFLFLYLPIINWFFYWLFFTIRVGVNKLAGREFIQVPRVRSFYVWYLNFPGSMALSEIIYRGYIFNT